jgi:hypothetical protein
MDAARTVYSHNWAGRLLRKWLQLSCILLAGTLLAARDKSDVIVMKNGDRFTCEIKSLDSDVLYIKLDYMLGNQSVDWAKVDHVESKQMFLVKTQSGRVYSGTLSTTTTADSRPATIEIVEPTSRTIELQKPEINKIEETGQSFVQRINGQVGLGWIYNRGNQATQYSLNADATYARDRWSASAVYGSNLSLSNGASTATRNEVNLSALRLSRWDNWYYTGLTDFLQSSRQGITLQSTFGGGVGRYLKNTGRVSLSVTGGFAWQQINYDENTIPSTNQQVTSALIASDVNLFAFDRTTLTASASLLPALSDPGRVHFNLNSSYYIKMWKKLTWNITFYGNWDNRPPSGFSGNDYGTSSGFNWKFGNR